MRYLAASLAALLLLASCSLFKQEQPRVIVVDGHGNVVPYEASGQPGKSTLAEVKVVNRLGASLTLALTGPVGQHITVPSGGTRRLRLPPGRYGFTGVCRGERTSGERKFKAGKTYDWTFERD